VAKADDISRKYREIYLRSQDVFEKTYRKAFDRVADQFARLINDPNVRFYKSYRFPPSLEMKMTAIMTDFHDDVLSLTEEEISDTWRISNTKNDKIVDNYLATITTIKEAQRAAYYKPNLDALKAFIGRERNAQTLSDSVWKIGKQLRTELETHLGIGITNGDSAQVISRRVRQYLDNPEALFRRVRDEKGKLVASKAMREYHPGQGVYRSAYKNAMRLARTETNMAYHSADNTRWRQLDMVIGVKISLSGSHPEYNFPEICEVCEGIYPKDFVWQGWHPHCLCHRTPVMTPSEDFLEYLKTGKKKDVKPVTEYPDGFKYFIKDNYERFNGYPSQPFWMQDNEEMVKGIFKEMS
jgi:hypothetical protein